LELRLFPIVQEREAVDFDAVVDGDQLVVWIKGPALIVVLHRTRICDDGRLQRSCQYINGPLPFWIEPGKTSWSFTSERSDNERHSHKASCNGANRNRIMKPTMQNGASTAAEILD